MRYAGTPGGMHCFDMPPSLAQRTKNDPQRRGMCRGCLDTTPQRIEGGTHSLRTGLLSNDECEGRCSAGKWSVQTGLTLDAQCEGKVVMGSKLIFDTPTEDIALPGPGDDVDSSAAANLAMSASS